MGEISTADLNACDDLPDNVQMRIDAG